MINRLEYKKERGPLVFRLTHFTPGTDSKRGESGYYTLFFLPLLSNTLGPVSVILAEADLVFIMNY